VSDTWGKERDVTDLSSPPSWFSCASEFYIFKHRDPMALFPPLVSWLSSGVQGLRFQKGRDIFQYPFASSLALRRHLKRLLPTLAAFLPMGNVDRFPPSKSTSRKLRTLQHLKIKEPFFSPFRASGKFGSLPRRIVPRVWLPFLRP